MITSWAAVNCLKALLAKMVGTQEMILSYQKNCVCQWEASFTFIQSEAANFSHAPNEILSAVVDLSSLRCITSQLLTSEGLTLQTLYYSTSELGIPKIDSQFI